MVAAPVVVVAVASAVVRALLSTFFAGEVLAGAAEVRVFLAGDALISRETGARFHDGAAEARPLVL